MGNKSIINIEKCQAVYAGNIESMVHSADLDNGSVVHVGTLVAGEYDLRNVVVPTTASITTEEIVVVASDEVIKDTYQSYTLSDFTNKTGKALKAYHVAPGDIFKVSADAITGTPEVGKYLIPANGATKLAVANDLTGGTRFAAKIIAVGLTIGAERKPAIRYQIVKA